MTSSALKGWGGTSPTCAIVERPHRNDDVSELLAAAPDRGALARGLGRSYGDSAQNAGGLVLDCTGLSGLLTIDLGRGEALVQAGTSLDDLMRWLVPLGWFVPVSPGTRFVTVGGAIASDIHGKNHHRDGSFGSWVRSLTLQLATGERRVLCPSGPTADAFWATTGGMGLTGVILDATIVLHPVTSSSMLVDTERAGDLDTVLDAMSCGDENYRYSVAWIDCMATGKALGRSVLTRGDHAAVEALAAREQPRASRFDPRPRLAAPPWLPSGLLNRVTVSAFNELWFRKAPRRRRGEIQSLAAFFHPLDGLVGWNRLYGPRGFIQHQCVVPFGAEETLRRIIESLAGSGSASFLAVLKRFGSANPGHLSFALPGWTLALDLPVGSPDLAALLDGIDESVVAAGGRLYLAKDARMNPALLGAMYPRLDEWRTVRATLDPDAIMRSDQSRRLGL